MFTTPNTVQIALPQAAIEAFCQRCQITRLELFGSVLREDFRSDSDIDVLVTFAPDAAWSLFDLVDMKNELTSIFLRPVDILTRKSIERSRNHLRGRNIIENARLTYER
ncbi:MAG: nucleotidyltransferase family protein [Chloroflexota bacterium]|nr:nucleotidyltransferase family protein [Chloroflexota bacterium]